ncbi:hypothetical protein LMJ53_05685 [Rheinheimera sp. UJ51]|uniref:hypothetical protein n=1 Tax=Rheinheimera sp. UJ51 TaxID=2892446 RepID=UPI001E4475D4|nr:hypothetical protein [Rheinheimera sp. UJ51]MCC5451222.1 hypothetical protein [Rheinheimera sp. UJ51]
MANTLQDSPLQSIHRRIQIKEDIFFYGMIASFISAILVPFFIDESWRVALLEVIILTLIIILFFCRNRASNCAHSITFAMHFETKDFTKAFTILKSSDCVKNADAFVALLSKTVLNRNK